MKKMLIELIENSNTVTVIEELEGGRKEEKTITMEDLISSIISSTNKGAFRTIKSPLYKEWRGIKLIQSKQIGENSHIYVLLKEKHKAPMQIFNRMYGNVGVPTLLYGVKVINDRMSDLFVVAIKDNVVIENTVIYKYPFTNVSGTLGKVCLGGNIFNKGISKGNELYKIPNQFFSMPNTMHSYRSDNNSKGLEFETMLKNLNDNEFDDDLLVDKDNLSYSQWFDLL